MQRREKIFWLLAGLALIVGVLSLIPAHYEICEQTKEKHCTAYQFVPFVGIKIAQILDKAGAAITALATIAIAAFTFTLKAATDRLWDAGERQLKLLGDTSTAQSRDMNASIDVSRKSADAAKKSADASLVALRPWI